jgi:hypothetical protein
VFINILPKRVHYALATQTTRQCFPFIRYDMTLDVISEKKKDRTRWNAYVQRAIQDYRSKRTRYAMQSVFLVWYRCNAVPRSLQRPTACAINTESYPETIILCVRCFGNFKFFSIIRIICELGVTNRCFHTRKLWFCRRDAHFVRNAMRLMYDRSAHRKEGGGNQNISGRAPVTVTAAESGAEEQIDRNPDHVSRGNRRKCISVVIPLQYTTRMHFKQIT